MGSRFAEGAEHVECKNAAFSVPKFHPTEALELQLVQWHTMTSSVVGTCVVKNAPESGIINNIPESDRCLQMYSNLILFSN